MRQVPLAFALVLGACAPPPRPAILEEADRTRTTAAAKEAEVLAPQAFLAAEKLRKDAGRAFDAGDRAGSQILAEQALAAYLHASVLARLAKADDRLVKAAARGEGVSREVAGLDEKQRRVAAEADDIELRFRVERDALPVAQTEPANPDREASRLASARALSLEARLLCVATQMLGPDRPNLTAAFRALDELDAEIQKKANRAPLDSAVRLRSACLAELTSIRRAAASVAPENGATDALLDELGRAAFEPRRDDRGVAVTLRDAFQGSALSAAARDRLTALGQVAKSHPAFPVLVVVHSAARGAPAPRDSERAAAVGKALTDAGAPKVETKAGGGALPVAPPNRADSAARNERVEIVFVAPAP
jgi:outer membrane protein OmpA-like peptidoglycan-associated protein